MATITKITLPDESIYDFRASSIPYGAVDSSSTSKAFTATVPGITALTDGVCVLLKNGVVTSASGFTLNVNGLGAKRVYSNMAAATAETTIFNANYTMLFIYDSTRVEGGGWICYRGYNSDTNTIGYQLRTNSTAMPASDTARYYKIYFTSADGTKWVPASVNSTNNATTARAVNQRPINPFGRIAYTSATTNFTAGTNVTATTLWSQYNLTLGYSFNRTGAALTLTTSKPIYIKCAPQSDGSAIMDADTPYVQDLPTTDDGKIYIFLGIATSEIAVEMFYVHPVYYYKDGAIRLWTNAAAVSGDEALTTAEVEAAVDEAFVWRITVTLANPINADKFVRCRVLCGGALGEIQSATGSITVEVDPETAQPVFDVAVRSASGCFPGTEHVTHSCTGGVEFVEDTPDSNPLHFMYNISGSGTIVISGIDYDS